MEEEGCVCMRGGEGEGEGRRKGEGEEEGKWERERLEDAMLLALSIEEGAMSQGMWTASGSWKSQGNGFSLKTSKRNTALLTYFKFLISLTVR